MRIRDLLLEDDVAEGTVPCYDKLPDEPAYIVSEDGAIVLAIAQPPRVFVPILTSPDADAATLALLKVAAEQGSTGIEWDGGFTPIQAHFNEQGLPLHVVLKHPDSPQLVPPPGVGILESPDVEKDRFYCLTTAEKLGRRPTRRGVVAHGVTCPDRFGLIVCNAKGILTVFHESEPRRFAIRAQS